MSVSDKAVEAARKRMRHFTPEQRWDMGGLEAKTDVVLAAAYPIIVAERDAQIIAVMRESTPKSRDRGDEPYLSGWHDALDAIERWAKENPA